MKKNLEGWCPYTANCETARNSYQKPMQKVLRGEGNRLDLLIAFRNYESHCREGHKNCPGFKYPNRELDIGRENLKVLKIKPDPVLAEKGIL